MSFRGDIKPLVLGDRFFGSGLIVPVGLEPRTSGSAVQHCNHSATKQCTMEWTGGMD